jgi:uncharacterized protein (TIGR03435 family)
MKSFAICLCLASLGLAADTPTFEVASIKASDPNPSNPMWIGMSADGAMVKYTNITLRDCIRGAFRARDFQIVGPEWMTNARFEISAKLPSGASTDQIPEMLQALLAERFKLEVRREKREQSVYALLVGNGGAKLKPAEIKSDNESQMALGPDGKPRPAMMYAIMPGGIGLTAPSATLESVVGLMSRFTARPVVDRTGIEGQYQFKFSFAPETNVALPTGGAPGVDGPATSFEPAPSVVDAVKQYGLRIEARKEPIEMFVVTHIEKAPTDN